MRTISCPSHPHPTWSGQGESVAIDELQVGAHPIAKSDVLPEPDGWGFSEGDEIVPGRTALRLLGGGTRYEAYLAFDQRLHSLVVVKIIRPDRVADLGALEGLQMEARAAQALNHPSIVRCFDAMPSGDRPHLVLEHVEGPRLSTLLRKYGPLGLEQLLPLGLQVCSALHYLSVAGFVHLDVKPANLIMGASPRLIDLSIARSLDEATRISELVGTDAYMAPEQCEPARFGEIGPGADMWGLGITMYEACTRSLPFPASPDGWGRFPQVGAEPRPMPVDLPPALTETILGCLDKDPEKRPTAASVAETLEDLLASLPRRRLLSRLRPR
jgi:eukaryotic-like serine/threonine-protein kinase